MFYEFCVVGLLRDLEVMLLMHFRFIYFCVVGGLLLMSFCISVCLGVLLLMCECVFVF